MAWRTSWLSCGSRIRKDNEQLLISTSRIVQALTLGTTFTAVRFSPLERRIEIRRRNFWIRRTCRVVRFDDVAAVLYGYEDWSLEADLGASHDSRDVFTIGLRLSSDEEISIARFFGAGEFVNESLLPDWCFWEDQLFDWAGTQDSESLLLAELISKMLGVKIERPRH